MAAEVVEETGAAAVAVAQRGGLQLPLGLRLQWADLLNLDQANVPQIFSDPVRLLGPAAVESIARHHSPAAARTVQLRGRAEISTAPRRCPATRIVQMSIDRQLDRALAAALASAVLDQVAVGILIGPVPCQVSTDRTSRIGPARVAVASNGRMEAGLISRIGRAVAEIDQIGRTDQAVAEIDQTGQIVPVVGANDLHGPARVAAAIAGPIDPTAAIGPIGPITVIVHGMVATIGRTSVRARAAIGGAITATTTITTSCKTTSIARGLLVGVPAGIGAMVITTATEVVTGVMATHRITVVGLTVLGIGVGRPGGALREFTQPAS